jgi:GDP/GTP exchange factor required for growth at low temperature
LEKLLPGSAETTVIRMSLAEDESVTPKDDPGFVIWGEVIPEPETDNLSVSQLDRFLR